MAFKFNDIDNALNRQYSAANSYNSRMAAANALSNSAQNRKSSPLESVLAGIGNTLDNTRKGLTNFFGTGAAALGDLISGNAARGTYDLQKGWKDWSKKELMGDENLSDKDYYAKSAGQALDTAATLSDFIPVVGAGGALVKKLGKGGIAALNIGQGIGSGIAQQYIDNGANISLDDAMRGGIVGGLSSGVGQYVGGKLANKVAGPGKISQAINSNLGKAALTGAASGAVGAGANTALQGGDLGQVLSNAAQGSLYGGVGGATMAGLMGLGGTALEKLNNKVTGGGAQVDTPMASKITKRVKTPTAEATDTVDNIATPTRQAQRRNIAVTDYDAGEQNVRVRRPDTEYSLGRRQGSNIDGILGPDNARKLPNAEVNAVDQFNRLFGDDTADVADAIRRGYFDVEGDDALSQKSVFRENLSNDAYEALKTGTRNYADFMNDVETVTGGAASAKSNLPKIRTSDYIEATGYKGKDIPDYMRPFLSEDGVSLKNSDWSEVIPKYNNGGQFTGTPDDILNFYETLANTNNGVKYTNENAVGALGMDSALNDRVNKEFLESNYPTRKIDIDKAPTIAENIDVESYSNTAPRKRVLNQQPQEVPQTQEAPMRSTVRRSTDMGNMEVNPNLSPAEVAQLERELTVNRQRQGAELLAQYGELSAPVRRSVGSAEDVLSTLYDDYGLKTPADVQYAANHVTGRDGDVSKWTRELASSAKDVDTTIGKQWLDDLMRGTGLTKAQKKSVVDQITAALERGGESVDGNTALDVMKQLEGNSSRYKGKDGTYHLAKPEEKAMGQIIDLVHDEIQDRLWEAAGDPQKVLTPERLTSLKNKYKDNEAWANFVDNKLAKVRNGAELRSTMKPLVDGAKIVNGSKMSAGGFAEKALKAGTSRNAGMALGQVVIDATYNSDKARQLRADGYAKKAATARAKLTGQEAPTNSNGTKGIIGGFKNIANKAGEKIGKATSALNNDTLARLHLENEGVPMGTVGDLALRQIARQPGLTQMRNQDAERDLQQAESDAQNAEKDYVDNMTQAQQLYNRATAQQQQETGMGATLNRIGTAMEMALNAGDVNAYSQLANLYKQAYSIYEAQNPTSASNTSSKALNATQAKAVTGLSQLQQLANMQPSMRTALANGPLGGFVDITGGDTYNSQADSLASTIGYLLSGANIKDNEIAAVKRDYVPSTFDSPQVRQEKLSRAEQLLRNYLSDTSALTSL